MTFAHYLEPAVTGFLLGGSLIIAIGAQNAFVLRLGLQRQHVFPIVFLCALSDALLILAGVAGMGALVKRYDLVLQFITWGGFAFLFVYGLQAFMRALKQEHMDARHGGNISLRKAILTVLAFTYLNPHVYLDTVLLVGGLSAQWRGAAQGAFAIGAITASFVWFFSLGYGARVLTPLFEKPIAWRLLDILIGSIMWLLALSLILTNVRA